MIIDVAVKADVLRSVLRNKFNALPICLPGDIPKELFSGHVPDHVEIDTPTVERISENRPIRLGDGTPKDVPGHRVRFNFGLIIYLASVNGLRKGGINGTTELIPLHLQVSYDLIGELQMDPNNNVVGAGLRTVYAGKDTTLPGDNLDAKVEEELKKVNQFIPMNLSPLEGVLDKPLALHNIGVATDIAKTRIVIRLEVGTIDSDPENKWKQFFSSPPDLLADRDWAMLIDRKLLLEIVVDRAKAALSKSKDIDLLEGPTAKWITGEDSAGIRLEMYIDLKGACKTTDFDIGAYVFSVTNFRLGDGPLGKELRFSNKITWDVTDSDVIICGLTTAIIGVVVGSIIGGIAGGPVGLGIGAAVGLIGSMVGVVVVADVYMPDPSKFQQPDCKTSKEDDAIKMECSKPLDLPENPLLGKLEPEKLSGDPQGMLLRGAINVPELEKSMIIKVTPMGWNQRLSCNTNSVERSLTGEVDFIGWKTALSVCRIDVVDQKDPVGYFVPELKAIAGNNHFRVRVGTSTGIGAGIQSQTDIDYQATPYPCRLLIRTSHGARFIDLGVLPEYPTSPDPNKVIKALAQHCFKEYNKFANELFTPDWVIKPRIGELVMQQWDVLASGLSRRSRVELVDGMGQVLASGSASEHGVAHAGAVISPERGLAVRQTQRSGRINLDQFDPEVHRLAITQRLLIHQRDIHLSGACRDLASFWGVGRKQLVAVTDAGLQVWDQDPVGGLVPVTWLSGVDFRGIELHNSGFVAFGNDGLWSFRSEEDGRAHPVMVLRDIEVSDTLSAGDHMVTLVDGQVVVFSRDLSKRRSTDIRDIESLTPMADGIALKPKGADYQTLYELSMAGDLVEVKRVPIDKSEVAKAKLPHSGSPRQNVRPQLIDSLDQDPQRWFDTTVMVTPWLAHLASDKRTIEVYARTSPAQATMPWSLIIERLVV